MSGRGKENGEDGDVVDAAARFRQRGADPADQNTPAEGEVASVVGYIGRLRPQDFVEVPDASFITSKVIKQELKLGLSPELISLEGIDFFRIRAGEEPLEAVLTRLQTPP